MKRFFTLTIAFLFTFALLPGYALAGTAESLSAAEEPQTVAFSSPPAPMPSLSQDQLSKLYKVYKIKRGDCLISIGKRFGVSWRYIADINGIKGPEYTIIAGKTLKIPLLPKLPGDTGNYLILCETEAQKKCLAEFAAFKTWRGYTVTVKSVEEDVKREADGDASEAIRQYLKKTDRKMSLEYVLLIGDPHNADSRCPQHTGGVIPMRYMYFSSSNHKAIYNGGWYDAQDPANEANNTPADIYYAIDIDWDYDKDGYAGEYDEIAKSALKANPEPMFLLGRIPFSDTKDIETVLKATMQYELGQKAHSDALVQSIGDYAFYGGGLAKNLDEAGIETTARCSSTEPHEYEKANPSHFEDFDQEIRKYDFVYTNNDFLYELVPSGEAPIGSIFMDGPSSMIVEARLDNINAQNFLANGTICCAITMTREVGFSPDNPYDRMASLLFSNGSLCISREFYAAVLAIMSKQEDVPYVYCYLGDPSIELMP